MLWSKFIKTIENPYMFSILSKIFIVLFGFGFTVCQSRYLGPSLKGDIAYVSSVTQITSIVFGVGIHQAYPYYKKKTNIDVAPFFTKITLLITIIYFFISISIVDLIENNTSIAAIILMTPLLVYNRIVAYINMIEEPNKKNAIELIADFILLVIVIVLWIFVPATFFWGVFLLVVKDIFLAIVYTYRLRKSLLFPCQMKVCEIVGILKYGVIPMLSLLMTTLNYRVDIIMLKQFVTSADVGIYSVGVMLAERVWMIPDALKEVMISKLAKGKGTDEVCFVIRICNSACVIVVFCLIMLGKPFINIFFGNEYSLAYNITVVILVGVVFMIYYKMIGAFNIVEGKQKENFIYLIISVICNIILNMILIPIIGNTGAAISSVFSYAISAGLFIKKFVKDNSICIKDMLFINKCDFTKLKNSLKR